MKHVLTVEDDKDILELITYNLEREGYEVTGAITGEDGIDAARSEKPDLILLDLMLPGIDGLEVCRRLKADPDTAHIPIVMVTAKGEETDIVTGLELGADDYVTKPFSPRELASRIRAVLRRTDMPTPVPKTAIPIDDRLEIDFRQREVIADGERIRLRPTEYRLLYHLVNNAGWVMTHEMLLSKVWGYAYRDDTHLLRVYITYLRQKIEPDPSHPRYIFTERGIGYRFVDFKQKNQGG